MFSFVPFLSTQCRHFYEIARDSPTVAALTIVLVALIVCWIAQLLLLVRHRKAILGGSVSGRIATAAIVAADQRRRLPAFDEDERLVPLRRSEEIVVPDWSDDTRECDDFRHARECDVSDGYRACFECVESRSTLRVCAHTSELITVRDVDDTTIVLPPNTSADKGYCVSEALAAQLRQLADPVEYDRSAARARRACRASNADWILVRQRASADAAHSSFNFACRCKYPHLMANAAGPMSACSRAVGCNGHGRLDEDSLASLVDPFVDGRCECDEGWISEYDASAGLGPYCREATVGEWPSLALSRARDDSGPYLDLFSGFIDAKFRESLRGQRLDRDENDYEPEVLLKDPCFPCPIVATDDKQAYFCGDELTVTFDSKAEERIRGARVGVRGERDYLRGNGGRYPNACLEFTEEELLGDRFLMQFLTTRDDDDMFAPEIGLFVRKDALERWLFGGSGSFGDSSKYRDFTHSLRTPRVHPPALRSYGTIWLFNDPLASEHRRRVVESLHDFYAGLAVSDIMYGSDDTLLVPFAYYFNAVVVNHYYYFPAGVRYRKDGIGSMLQKYRLQRAQMCPDVRGLDSEAIYNGSVKTSKEDAHAIARSMVPVCLKKQRYATNIGNTEHLRPRINCQHPNDTACVMVEGAAFINYAYLLWYPSNMKMRQLCSVANDKPPTASS